MPTTKKPRRRAAPKYTVSHYCTCGSSFKATADPSERAGVDRALAIVKEQHRGDGHRETDAHGAANARYEAGLKSRLTVRTP